MAAVTRQQVMEAILTLLQNATFSTPVGTATTWTTLSRKLRLWGTVAPEEQPAAFLVTHRETDEYTGLGLSRRRLELGVWCYVRADGDDTIGSEFLDTMLEAIENVLIPDNPSDNTLTLGRLVYWCRIEGRVLKDPGDIDGQAMMIVPIVVEMP